MVARAVALLDRWSDRQVALLAAAAVSMSVAFAVVSNHYESRVMGSAALGVAVLAPTEGSEAWQEKESLRRMADWSLNLSFILSGVAALLDIALALRAPARDSEQPL